jgi:DNA-binding transcriptional regulator/RsmH inhibitor MraZ
MALFNKKQELFGNRPMEWVDASLLKLAPWRTTYIIKTDLEVLARSMEDYGWLQPLVVQKSSNMIIDGAHRWMISGNLGKLRKATDNTVPVLYVDCDDIEAMLMHGRLNRGRGEVLAQKLSRIIKSVIRSRKYGETDIKRMFVMHMDEVDLMVDGTLLIDKNISEHKYSSAWVPIEAPASAKDAPVSIERPPNADG